MRHTRHGGWPGALILGSGLLALLGPAPRAAARTVNVPNHATLVKLLLRPAPAGVRYRFGARLVARGEVDAEWLVIRNRRLLGRLTWARTLSLHRARVPSFAFLRRLKLLQRLDLRRTSIRSLAPLRALTRLRELDVADTRVRSLAPLKGLVELEVLDLSGTRVTDLSPLRGRHLERLTLAPRGSALPDLTPLSSIGRLRLRRARPRTDFSSLKRVRVQELVLDGTRVQSLGALADHPTLQRLSLRHTRVPVSAVRRLLRKAPGMTVILPDGRTVGRVLVWIRVAPSPGSYPCLIGAGECARETYGPQRRPTYKFVMP